MKKSLLIFVFTLLVLTSCGGSEKSDNEEIRESKKATPGAKERQMMTAAGMGG